MNGKPSKSSAEDFDKIIDRHLNSKKNEELSMLGDDEFMLVDEEGVETQKDATEGEDPYPRQASEDDEKKQIDKELEAKLKKEVSEMKGKVVGEPKIIKGGHILAMVKMKGGDKNTNKGLYLVLKIKGEKLLIYGDEHADKLNENTIKLAYRGIGSMPFFLEESAKFKESLNMYLEEGAESKESLDAPQKKKVEKMQDEFSTIGGFILKTKDGRLKIKFFRNNLLALVKVDKKMQEMVFGEEKTDPEKLRGNLIRQGKKIDCIKNMRDDIYVVLAMGDITKILGEGRAHTINAEEEFKKIHNLKDFFSSDSGIKK